MPININFLIRFSQAHEWISCYVFLEVDRCACKISKPECDMRKKRKGHPTFQFLKHFESAALSYILLVCMHL